MLVGKGLDVPVVDITGVHESKGFRGGVVAGQTHVVVETAHGEAGFFVKDRARWVAAFTAIAQRPR
jgi:hypothetical protein